MHQWVSIYLGCHPLVILYFIYCFLIDLPNVVFIIDERWEVGNIA